MPDEWDADADDEPDPEAPDESDMDSHDSPDLEVCPHCRKLISEETEQCPHCRQYLTQEDKPLGKPAWIVIGTLVALAIVLLVWVI